MIAIAETVAQLGDGDSVKAYQARRQLCEAVAHGTVSGKSSDRTALASALAEELTAKTRSAGKEGKQGEEKPRHSARVRNELAQLLGQVADDAQVPALAAALEDLETREMARWALERVPTAAATSALVKALEQVGPEFRVGVINSLARRRTPEVLALLHRQAGEPDEEVRLAAVEALAGFPEASSDDAIVAAGQTGSARARRRSQKARIRLADTLRLAGNKEAAVTIYRAVLADDADDAQKKAARRGLEQLT